MTADAETLIADVLRQHEYRLGRRDNPPAAVEWYAACRGCDWTMDALDDGEAHIAHQAEAVVAALGGLTPEPYPMPDRNLVSSTWEAEHRDLRRWVSGWTPEAL